MSKKGDFYDHINCPKVLVVSHNCFSKNGSNGRTLGNLFTNWPKEALAQFYITNEFPNSEVCDNYFRVTDTEALKAFYKGDVTGRIINKKLILEDKGKKNLSSLHKINRKKTSIKYIVRNFIWDSNRWKNKNFEKWINDYNPDIILIQLGDYAFMLRIALTIAEQRDIPVIIYNSEDYYFKDKKSLSPLYHFYRTDYKYQFRKLMSNVSFSVYNSEMLQNTYQNDFKHCSTVIMTSSDVTPKIDKEINSPLIITYLGNLGVGRHEPLIEIANTLQELDPNIFLDVYGKAPNSDVEKALNECTGIRQKGFVPYDEVISIMKSSDLLLHAENFSDFSRWDLKHGFSTKIADSLASGTCFFMYAPDNLASVRYLMEKKAAYVVTNKNDLKEALRVILNDEDLRQSCVDNALRTVKDNHNINLNANKFKSLIVDAVKKVSENK